MKYAIITYITTIIISLIVNSTNDLTLFKDIFNNSYKFNIKNFDKIKKELKSIFPNKNIFLSLIPIYNLMTNLSSSITYDENKHKLPEYLKQLEEKNIVKKMTKDEITKYSKHPNILNALYISSKTTNQEPIQIKTETESTLPSIGTTPQKQINKYSYINKQEQRQESNISKQKQFLIYLLSELLTEQEIDKIKETKNLTREKKINTNKKRA